MCVSIQAGKSDGNAIRINHAGYDATLTLYPMLDRPCGVTEDLPDGRLPSAKDQITYFHIYIIPKDLGEVKIYFR